MKPDNLLEQLGWTIIRNDRGCEAVTNTTNARTQKYLPAADKRFTYPVPLRIDEKRESNKIITTVAWGDGTTTKVACAEDDPSVSRYYAFCAAFAKKMFGNGSVVKKVIEDADGEKIDKHVQEIKAACKREKEKREAERREQKVKELAKRILKTRKEARIYEEAVALADKLERARNTIDF